LEPNVTVSPRSPAGTKTVLRIAYFCSKGAALSRVSAKASSKVISTAFFDELSERKHP
jgi:hypothetical protein